ncbi:hypothetical protein ACFXOJ_41830, partial [Streptomyces vinaceus]
MFTGTKMSTGGQPHPDTSGTPHNTSHQASEGEIDTVSITSPSRDRTSLPRITCRINRAVVSVLCAMLAWSYAPLSALAHEESTSLWTVTGTTSVDFGSDAQAHALAVQDDGHIVTVGTAADEFAISRHTADGTLDSSFGKDRTGRVVTKIRGAAVASAAGVQPDGRIVAVGSSGDDGVSDFALVRYTAAGKLDDSFGEGGRVVTDFQGGFDVANSVAVQPDGR